MTISQQILFVPACVLWLNCINGHNRHCFLGLALIKLCVDPIGSFAIGECRNRLHEIPQSPAKKFLFIINCLAAEFNSSSSLSFNFSPRLIPVSIQMDISHKNWKSEVSHSWKHPKLWQAFAREKKCPFQKYSYSPNLCVTVNASLQGECRGFS